MDIARLFRACRVGDLHTVQTLIETKDIDINIRDKFDSSPLYYACLCGHVNLVRFLLENGARCDVSTFDGERCFYGALTRDIRRLLVDDYKVISKKVIRRNDYDEFFRKALECGEFFDVVFKVHNETFKAHRSILSARCDYFCEMFFNKWKNRQVVTINNISVNADAFRILLHYLYTGVLEFHIVMTQDVLLLMRQCKLDSIYSLIEDHCKNLSFSAKSKSKNKSNMVLIERPVNDDYEQLFQSTLPSDYLSELYVDVNDDFGDWNYDVDFKKVSQLSQFSDVMFKLGDKYFKCNKLFFSGRSDFFRALFQDHFDESCHSVSNIPVFELKGISVDSFTALISFIYTNSCDIHIDQAFELLFQSDVYLLNGLKKFCSKIIANHILELNAIDLIRLSRMFNLPKLESTAVQHIANHLDQFIGREDFQQLIISDAKEIKARQETDTIDIIDDIRYHLFASSNKDMKSKLKSIETLLDKLGLKVYSLEFIY